MDPEDGRGRSAARGWRRRLALPAAIAAIAAFAACGHEQEEEIETETAVPVKVAAAERGEVHGAIAATGTVIPEPGSDWTALAPERGRILAITKAEGDPVKKGEVLVRIQVPSLDADAAARRADVERAEAELSRADHALERADRLFQKGIAARKDVEDARRDQAAAAAGAETARSAREAAELVDSRTVIRAPFDGIVAHRWHSPGDMVDASTSDPVLRVIGSGPLQVEAAVPSVVLDRVAAGAAATVHAPGGGDVEATVAGRPGSVDPVTSSGTVRLALTGSHALVAGTPVLVEIQMPAQTGVVLVPDAAVLEEGETSYVLVAGGDGKAHRREVEVGVSGEGRTEVEKGLEPGEKVVVEGQNALPDGATITVGE